MNAKKSGKLRLYYDQIMSFLRSIFITVFISVFCYSAFSEQLKDSVLLQTHIVFASKSNLYHSGAVSIQIDSATLSYFENSSLADLLKENSLAAIKNYGSAGSLSTASMRGMSANHIQLNWNGVSFNSLTSGDVNLALIPAGIFEAISLTPNASGANYGSGSSGGAINLSSSAKSKNSGQFSTEYTSLHSVSTLYKINTSRKGLNTSTNAWFQTWKNDYDYFDAKYKKTMKRKNADYRTNGLLHNTSYALNDRHKLGLGLWIQETEKNLPALNGSNRDNYEFQNDRSLRTYLSYNYKTHNRLLSVNGGYMDDFLHYGKKVNPSDSLLSINSKIGARRLYANTEFQYYGSEQIKVIGGMHYSYNWPESNNFAEDIQEQTLAFYTSLKYAYKQLTASVSLRQEYYSAYRNPLLFGIGAEYLFHKVPIKLHASANQKYRIPTFNERFWQNLGNPDLPPESGITYEAGATLFKIGNAIPFTFDVLGYTTTLNDMIRWLTVDGILGPHSYANVHARGLEASLKSSLSMSPHVSLKNNTQFAFNKTTQQLTNTEESIDNERQLPYAPHYIFGHSSILSYKNYGLRLSYHYTGQQHYDDTDWWLPSLHTVHSTLMYHTIVNGFKTSVQFHIDNLMGKNQEFIKNYPAPGRIYRIKLNINI